MPHINDKRHLMLCLVLSFAHLPLLYASEDTSTSIIKFQQTMAAKGHPSAQYKLAMIYETGDGVTQSGVIQADVTQNIAAARIWYSRAANQAYKPAAHRLKYLDMLQNQTDADQSWLAQLQRDADAGDGEVMLLLGQMVANGSGLPADLKRATYYLRKARSLNVPGSEAELARVDASIKQQTAQQTLVTRLAAAEEKHAQQKTSAALAEQHLAEQQRLQHIQQQKKIAQAQLAQRQQLLAEQQRQLQSSSTSPAKPEVLADRKTAPAVAAEPANQSPCFGRNQFAPTCR